MENLHIMKGAGPLSGGCVLTIGNFDGAHLGHQALFRLALDIADKKSLKAGIFTFHPHPAQILRPDLPFLRIFDYQDQREQAQKWGFDFLVEEPFTADLSRLSAEEFFKKNIIAPLNPQAIVVGYDFGFGSGRKGSLDVLKNLCDQSSIELHVVPAVVLDSKVISSTAIRETLGRGEVDLVSRLLGRNFYLKGIVVHGDHRGRTIGVPTANIRPQGVMIPRFGVYISTTRIDEKLYPGITNVGVKPTFQSDSGAVVETHLFDFNQDIYGQDIRVELHQFLREERRFAGLSELLEVMKADIEKAKQWHQK